MACLEKSGETTSPRKSYPYEVKLEAVRLAEEEHLTRREIAVRLDLCAPAMVSKWVTIAREHGRDALMPKRDPRGRQGDAAAHVPAPLPDTDVEELLRQNARLRMDNAILEETIKALKKDPGVDPGDLSNRERAAVADALRDRFPLNDLLSSLGLARSTYYYERGAIAAGDR
jgi:transposase-like protein